MNSVSHLMAQKYTLQLSHFFPSLTLEVYNFLMTTFAIASLILALVFFHFWYKSFDSTARVFDVCQWIQNHFFQVEKATCTHEHTWTHEKVVQF